MKKSFCFLLVVLSSLLFSQRENIDAKIILKDKTELSSKIKFKVNFFAPNEVDESSVAFNNVLIIDQNNKFQKTPSSAIQRIEFTDLKNKNRVFIGHPEFKNLVELLYDGKKIKWIRSYYKHGYDHSTLQSDHLIKANTKILTLGIFTNNRKKIKELTSDRPDLIQYIEKVNYDKLKEEDLLLVLEKYEESN